MDTRRQVLTFIVAGITTNAVLYGAYLLLTALGVGHKTSMSLLFATGTLCGYLLNRRWTFRHGGRIGESAGRYFGTYAFAYLLNIAAMFLLVDLAHFSHRAVMLALIVVTAGLTFVLQKRWVFSRRSI